MLEMNYSSLSDPCWQAAGVRLPGYSVADVAAKTAACPRWVHFGAGNIFRGFIARIAQRLLEAELSDSGIIAADTFDFEIIERIYKPYDNLTMMVDLAADGSTACEIIGSVTQALRAGSSYCDDMASLRDIFASPSLQIVSFTITEKGYALRGISGDYLPLVLADFNDGPAFARHAMSVVCALVYHRYKTCAAPIALASMDNCSENGRVLKESITEIAHQWLVRGFVDEGFIKYLSDPDRCSFPWSMIDKITPRPAQAVEQMLAEKGIGGMEPVTTSRGTYMAPFVNAEIPQYLVIEDSFPNGRPPFEKAGVYVTDRETVNKAERMKVMTCLNPLHTALAVFGCLLGYSSIAEEMKDPQLRRLVERIGYDEGMPVVVDPGIIRPADFLEEVLTQRLPNPFIPDMPQRIATDTSQKIPVRFGQTIRAYIESDSLEVTSLECIPLAIAGWLRYLLAVDDNGYPMEVSPDPMLVQLREQLAGVSFGCPDSCHDRLNDILSNKNLFAADLCECGLAPKVYDMLAQMLEGEGAVRRTLEKYIG